jgi:hypothetical protein
MIAKFDGIMAGWLFSWMIGWLEDRQQLVG